ncbi:DUF4232 domain-containing protein [Kitasatospora sp. NPDC004669]|uniref:DUF4232 domain-containing protein n=1 Tax=Kitasatospora sp. NPDC004669 TaxID=3154555 RepID=UPI0033B0099B
MQERQVEPGLGEQRVRHHAHRIGRYRLRRGRGERHRTSVARPYGRPARRPRLRAFTERHHPAPAHSSARPRPCSACPDSSSGRPEPTNRHQRPKAKDESGRPSAFRAGGAAVTPQGRTEANWRARTGGGSGASVTPAAPTSHGGKAADRCHTADLKADIQMQPLPDAPTAMVMLTDKSSRTCTVYGYLGYGGLLADNNPVATGSSLVAHPGQPVEATLKPGVCAFSGLKWSTCDKAEPTCKVLAGITVTPPDETTQLTADLIGIDGKPVHQVLTVSAAGFTVGSLQPISQSVVFTS